jgi:hypothetical protein
MFKTNTHENCNYGYHNNNQIVSNGNLNAATVADKFITEYYQNVSNGGWNSCLYLFDNSCVVICKEKIIGNAIDMLSAFSSEYVKKANYDKLHIKWVIINNTTLLINVFGYIQFVSFNNICSIGMQFTETFVLTINPNNNVIKCTCHLFDW